MLRPRRNGEPGHVGLRRGRGDGGVLGRTQTASASEEGAGMERQSIAEGRGRAMSGKWETEGTGRQGMDKRRGRYEAQTEGRETLAACEWRPGMVGWSE